jgi:hypothetical protein
MVASVPTWVHTADRVEFWAEAYQGGSKVADLEVVDGSVTGTAGKGTRWSCQLTVAGWDGVAPTTPATGSDRLYGDHDYGTGIYGNYRREYYKGLLLPIKTTVKVFCKYTGSGGTHTLPMGVFTVRDLSFTDAPGDFTVSISGTDGVDDFAKLRWAAPFTIAKGTNLATAIGALVSNRDGSLSVSCPSTSKVVGRKRVYLPGAGLEPWTELEKLCSLGGWGPYFDRGGDLVVDAIPEPFTGTPVWEFTDATNVQRVTVEPQGSEIVNQLIVVVRSASDDEPPIYKVVTRADGPYGTTALGKVRADEVSLDGVDSMVEAEEAALAALRDRSRWQELVTMDVHPCEWLDPGDVITVTDDWLELTGEHYSVERITYPLSAGAPTQVQAARRLG